MKLTRVEFDFLSLMEREGPKRLTQKQIAEELSCSVGIVNKAMRRCAEQTLIEVHDKIIHITERGLAELEPYRVKSAIILAAGFSERLAPVTLTTPKPLVTIRGVRIVDTLIDALLQAQIEDITVVVGYKAKQFQVLQEKYTQIRLRENPLYNQSGNITTLLSAVDDLRSCYICDADLYVRRPQIIRKYEYRTCFFGVPVAETDDWCFSLRGARVHHFRIGGEHCHKAVFLTYVNASDAEKLKLNLDAMVHSHGGREHHWFDALFTGLAGPISVFSKECYADDVYEVDTLGDLIQLDQSYVSYTEGFAEKG